MRRALPLAAILLGSVLLGACTAHWYDPPVVADHATPEYHKTLNQCRNPADLKARQEHLGTPWSALASVFESQKPERQEILACMQTRGFVLRPGETG